MKKQLVFTFLLLVSLLSSKTLKAEIIFQIRITQLNHSGNGGYGVVTEVDRPLYGAFGTIILVTTEITCRDNGDINCHGCAALHIQKNGGLVGIPTSLPPYCDAMYQTAVSLAEGGQSSGSLSNQYSIEGSGLFIVNVSWNPNPTNNGFNYLITISRP
jgi:hypothetical protein